MSPTEESGQNTKSVGDLRTDLIGAYIIKDWLDKFTPAISKDWQANFDPAIRSAAETILKQSAAMQPGYVSQNMLAWAAIDRWQLQGVTLLAGGTPTPLSPTPSMITYYTDANPVVVEEARRCGYATLEIDIAKPNDLEKIRGSETLIGTGLLHFMDDQTVTTIFALLETLDIQYAIFNNGNLPDGPEFEAFLNFFKRIGRPLHIRTTQQMDSLITSGWRLKELGDLHQMLSHMGSVGEYLAGMPNLFNTYVLARI